MRVSQDVLQVLDRSTTDGPKLFLPPGQLDRKLYEAVNKALVCAGGKWARGPQAHIFPGDAAEAIEPIILTGEITDAKREFQAFYTPPALAAEVIRQARIVEGLHVLEPSAGEGALAIAARDAGAEVTCVELNRTLLEHLEFLTGRAICADFLTLVAGAPPQSDLGLYDRVVMNPPFAKLADAKHVLHASKFLAPGGRLVAIMGAGVLFRQDALYVAVRDLVQARAGSITPLPVDSFKASGTSVNTVLVVFDAEAV